VAAAVVERPARNTAEQLEAALDMSAVRHLLACRLHFDCICVISINLPGCAHVCSHGSSRAPLVIMS
jgi:hypothetical protein